MAERSGNYGHGDEMPAPDQGKRRKRAGAGGRAVTRGGSEPLPGGQLAAAAAMNQEEEGGIGAGLTGPIKQLQGEDGAASASGSMGWGNSELEIAACLTGGLSGMPEATAVHSPADVPRHRVPDPDIFPTPFSPPDVWRRAAALAASGGLPRDRVVFLEADDEDEVERQGGGGQQLENGHRQHPGSGSPGRERVGGKGLALFPWPLAAVQLCASGPRPASGGEMGLPWMAQHAAGTGAALQDQQRAGSGSRDPWDVFLQGRSCRHTQPMPSLE